MINNPIAPEISTGFHEALPQRIRDYLNARGINDEVIDLHGLGWDGQRITIPIHNRAGELVSFKLAKDPDDPSGSPKMLYTAGSTAELYGWERVLARPTRIIICEGEFDRLALESQGFGAVTSTGGAGVFRPEWAEDFWMIPEVYLCFDNDEPGRNGAAHVAQLIPQAKIIQLPAEVGEGGDVTDYFARLNHIRDEFLQLMLNAQRPVVPLTPAVPPFAPRLGNPEARELKAQVRIEQVIGKSVDLQQIGLNLRGRCPFHQDQVPSLVVYSEGQRFYCFGCQAKGDVLTFLMRHEGLSFRDALDRLRELATAHEQAA